MSFFSADLHAYDRLDMQAPPYRPAVPNFGSSTDGSIGDADQEQLKGVFLDNNVFGIDAATWKSSAPGGVASQVVANIPITHHYLVDSRYRTYDVLPDELVFMETNNGGSDAKAPRYKLGVAAMNRWLDVGGVGYEKLINERTAPLWLNTWQFRGVQITIPSAKDDIGSIPGKRNAKDEALVVANTARTNDIWAYQAYQQPGDAMRNPNADGARFGDHLFLLLRRVPDRILPIYSAQRVLVNLQEPRWHWQVAPFSGPCCKPPECVYKGLRDFPGQPNTTWYGTYIHVGNYAQTYLRAASNTGKDFPTLASRYLFSKDGVDAFRAYEQLRRIEIVLHAH